MSQSQAMYTQFQNQTPYLPPSSLTKVGKSLKNANLNLIKKFEVFEDLALKKPQFLQTLNVELLLQTQISIWLPTDFNQKGADRKTAAIF